MTNHRARLIKLFWLTPDYRDFISNVVDQGLDAKLKTRAHLARVLKLSPPMVTKVFSKKGHLSPENLEIISRLLDFNESETMAFLDKMSWARATSQNLKSVLEKRLSSAFESSQRPLRLRSNEKAPAPGNYLYFKIVNLLSQQKLSLAQLCKKLDMPEARLQFLIEQMSAYFKIEQTTVGSVTYLHCPSSKFESRRPHSEELQALALSLHRMASYSLESRYPIHIVGSTEHYVNGCFVVPLSPQQISELQIEFTNLTNRIIHEAASHKMTAQSKLVAITYDLFDTNI